VVLVGHYSIEANLIDQGVLFVILVVQHMGFLRVEVGIWEHEPCCVVLIKVFVSNVAIGLLREPIVLNLTLRAG
jgi:hypothetical protein